MEETNNTFLYYMARLESFHILIYMHYGSNTADPCNMQNI